MILDKSLEWFLSWLAPPNPIHLYFGLYKIKYVIIRYHNGYIGIHIGINIRWYIKWNLIFLYAINNHFLPFLYLDREISLFDILWLITQFKISFNLEFSSLSSKTSNPIRQSGEFQRIRNLLVRCLKEKIFNVYQFLLYWVSRKQATKFISQD